MKRKILLVLLSLLFCASCAVLFGACAFGNGGETSGGTENGWSVETVYAQAQELGYEGSLQEFIALVSGKDGADGQDGADGKNGQDGTDGVGVADVRVEDGALIVELTNGEEIDCGSIRGEQGEPGAAGEDGDDGDSVQSASINQEGELVLVFVSGREINVGKVVGADGENGANGADGADGVGVADVRVEGGVLIVELTNGEEIDCGAVSACTHRFSDWETVLEPTCTSVGYSRRTCADCGYTEYEFSEALGHDVRLYQPLHSPSAHSGSCERCGVHVQQRHTFEEGVCTVCEWSETSLEYTLNADFSSWSVTGIGGFSGSELVIPATYQGAPVTAIGDRAFFVCSNLTSVVIPETVTSIGEWAFSSCSNLTSIVIPEGVASIGEWAFDGCSNLTSVVIPEGVTSIGDQAFYRCSNLTSIVIPEGVTSIGSRLFQDCSSLTSIVIPEGVTSIGSDAFNGCSSLTSIVIPETVTSIGFNAFSYCSSLTSVVIPEGVTSIGNQAFYGHGKLTSVVFRSVEPPEIGEDVFGWAWASPEFCVYVPAGSLEAYESVDDSLWQTHLVEAGKIKEM